MTNTRRQVKKARSEEARRARKRAAQRKRIMKILIVIAVVGLSATGLAAINASRTNPSCPDANGTSTRRIDFSKPQPDCINEKDKYAATFDTTEGKIVVDLDTNKTPKTTDNFVALARFHYYDDTSIFRTDPTIDIIQGGSPHTQDASDRGPGYSIVDEGSGYKYSEGDLVMARGPKGAAAQFFFSAGPDTAKLTGEYVTFGKTREGLDVLKKIIDLHQGGETSGSPGKTVKINSVKITQS